MQKRILALVSDDFEDLELWYPVLRLREEGCQVDLAAEKKGQLCHGKYGVPCTSEFSFLEVNPADYDGILVPGGWAPDKLRRFPEVLAIVRKMNEDGKVIGEICHASTPDIRDDMENAGAIWHDQASVVDGNIVSARRPPDLPAYMKDYIRVLNG